MTLRGPGTLTRRRALALGAAAGALAALPRATRAQVAAFTGGAALGTEGVALILPDLAENGLSVPVTIAAPGADAILLVAPANPDPQAAIFRFGALAEARIETRIRLAESQSVRAVARFPDGRFAEAVRRVEVIIGGCDI